MLLRALLAQRAKDDTRVVLCEAPSPVILEPPRNDKPLVPAMTPRRLTLDIPRDVKKDTKRSEEFHCSAPIPSKWPCKWALFQINANYPIEDRAFVSVHPIKKTFLDEQQSLTGWLLAAVIDGHSGWQTAEYVQRVLGARIEKHISAIKETNLTAANVAAALTKAFEQLDAEIKGRVDPAFTMGYHMVAKPGATTCACLLSPSKIICANVGDTMAILCRGGCPIKLSYEHNCGVPEEGEKMRRLHPNEPDIVYDRSQDPKKREKDKQSEGETPAASDTPTVTTSAQIAQSLMKSMTAWLRFKGETTPTRNPCYLKGRLQLTRAFGDFYLKELKYAIDSTHNRCLVDPPHSFPYVTCTPDVSIMDRDAVNDEFIIIATDGLWDWITPAEACAFIRPLLRKGKTVTECIDLLKEHLYKIWVSHANAKATQQPSTDSNTPWTIEKLMELPPAERRRKFDDMTISLISLQNYLPETNTSGGSHWWW